MTKNRLINSLKRIQHKLCAYIRQPCDCKFMKDEDSDDHICKGSENGSGCSELFLALNIIEVMTPTEFTRILKRAKLSRYFKETELQKK